jgi:hypothetical protein
MYVQVQARTFASCTTLSDTVQYVLYEYSVVIANEIANEKPTNVPMTRELDRNWKFKADITGNNWMHDYSRRYPGSHHTEGAVTQQSTRVLIQ